MSADESSVLNGGQYVGDRASQASSTDLNELTNASLALEANDRESVLTEDEETDTPVKPSLRLATGHLLFHECV